MESMNLEDRIKRLERTVTALAAIISGEAHRVGTPEEIAALTARLADDLSAMARDLLL